MEENTKKLTSDSEVKVDLRVIILAVGALYEK